MAKTDEPFIEPTINERVRGQMEEVAARSENVVALGADELTMLLEGVEGSVRRALGEQPNEHNYAPAFSIGALFGAVLAIAAVVVGALIVVWTR